MRSKCVGGKWTHIETMAIPPPPPPPPPPPAPTKLRCSSSSFHLSDVHLTSTSTPLVQARHGLQHLNDDLSSIHSQDDRPTYQAINFPAQDNLQATSAIELQRPSKILRNELRRYRGQTNLAINMTNDNDPRRASGHHFCQRGADVDERSNNPHKCHQPVHKSCRVFHPKNKAPAPVAPADMERAARNGQDNRSNGHKTITNTSLVEVEPREGETLAKVTATPTVFDGNKKSRCILFSQIYLIAHISLSICLYDSSMAVPNEWSSMSLGYFMLNVHLVYILVASLAFFLILRCYARPSEDDVCAGELVGANSILIGATLLCFGELVLIALNIATDCLETELVVLPLLKFAFAIFLVHFLLTQAIHSGHIGLRNIALAHLVATQISLWILSLAKLGSEDQSEDVCRYLLDDRRYRFVLAPQNNATVSREWSSTWHYVEVYLKPTLQIVSHQFKLLTIFILIALWFTNNQSKINFIRAKLSDEEVVRASGERQRSSLRGLLYGSLMLALACVTVVFADNLVLRHTSAIFIQAIISIVALIGLVIRGRKKYLNPKYQVNVLKHHYIIFITLLLTYISVFVNIVLQLQQLFNAQSDESIAMLAIVHHTTLVVQVTIQTYLLRLQGKKLVDMSNIVSVLAMANLALFVIDVSQAVWDNKLLTGELIPRRNDQLRLDLLPILSNSHTVRNILSLFVLLNRTYSALIFLQFWRLQI